MSTLPIARMDSTNGGSGIKKQRRNASASTWCSSNNSTHGGAIFAFVLIIGAGVAFMSGILFQRSLEITSSSSASLSEEVNLMLSSLKQIPTTTAGISSTLFHGADDPYRLAREQSFGFFDDITNENWQVLQEIHARAFPNHYEATLERHSGDLMHKKDRQAVKEAQSWYAQNFQEEFHCAGTQRIPSSSSGDGPKWVCDPHRLKKKKDCLVYSVGSNGKVEFEKGIRDEIGTHCEIHTFDLVNYNKRNGYFAEALDGIASFHHWGLATLKHAERSARNLKGPSFKTLEQTMAELGHTNRTIDIFKIDCEWCEWETFRDWLNQDIRQLLVETHTAPMPQAQDFFYSLHDAGYVIFSKEANYYNGGALVEYAMIKLHPDFFIRDSMYSKKQVAA